MNLSSIVPVPNRVSTAAKLYLIGTILNGFANGIFNVVIQLYLTSFGFESKALGTIVMMNAVGSALLTIPAGVIADRYGKRKVMLFGLASVGLSIILILTAKSVEMFMLGFLLVGLSNAAFVVLGPLYSSFFDRGDLDKAFGLSGFLNIISVSMGSLMGFIPPILVGNYGFSTQASYWTMMIVGAVFVFPSIVFRIMSLRGVVEPKREGGFEFNLRSKGVVAKFSLLNIVGNIGLGAFFSLFPYYVNQKFGAESDALGTLYFVSNFVNAGAYALAPRISQRLGTLKTIVVVRALSSPFLLMIPLAPNFAWLSVFYILRLGIVNLSSPLGSSLFYKLLYEEEKATANSITTMASMGGNIVAPRLGGQLMEQVSLDFPAFLGAGLYPVVVASYYYLFRNEKEKRVEQKSVVVDH